MTPTQATHTTPTSNKHNQKRINLNETTKPQTPRRYTNKTLAEHGSLPRKNKPHVPTTPQRHHLHPPSKRNMRTLHSTPTMPQRSLRISSDRHARSMGRLNITTTSRRTKTARHQTKTPIHLPNVGPILDRPIADKPHTHHKK